MSRRAPATDSIFPKHAPRREESQKPNLPAQVAQRSAAPLTQIVRRAQIDPSRLPSGDVLHLQRTIGNQGVVQLLNRATPQAQPPAIQTTLAAGPEGGEAGIALENRVCSGGSPMPKSIQRTLEPKLGAPTHIQRFPWSKNKPKISIPKPEEYTPESDYQSPTLGKHITNDVIEQGDSFRLTLGVEEAEENFISGSMKFHMNKMMGRFGKKNMEKPYSTGHSWVELQVFGNRQRLASDSYGFTGAGFEHPDHNTGARGSEYLLRDYTVGKGAFQKVVDRARTLEAKGLEYKTKGYNCTSFARDLVKTAGISFPGSRMLPGMRVGAGSVFTPARLHQALAKGESKGTAYKRMKKPKSIDEVIGTPEPEEVVEAIASQQESSGDQASPAPPQTTTPKTPKLSIPAISAQAERVLMQNLHTANPLQTLIDHEVALREELDDMTSEQKEQLAAYIGKDSSIIDGWVMFLES